MGTSLPQTLRPIYSRQFTSTAITMGVQKTVISPGNGTDRPQKGDNITMEYTGCLHDANAPEGKGKQFDSSVGRGDFNTKIGVGQLIKGWDEGIIGTAENEGMTLGEKATPHHRRLRLRRAWFPWSHPCQRYPHLRCPAQGHQRQEDVKSMLQAL